MTVAENSSKEQKTLREKEKLLFTSNFSFYQSVSKYLYCRYVKTEACLGKSQSSIDRYQPSQSAHVDTGRKFKLVKCLHFRLPPNPVFFSDKNEANASIM